MLFDKRLIYKMVHLCLYNLHYVIDNYLCIHNQAIVNYFLFLVKWQMLTIEKDESCLKSFQDVYLPLI